MFKLLRYFSLTSAVAILSVTVVRVVLYHHIVVNKHGGKIIFETGEEQGTTFVIRLPLGGQAATSEAA